MAQRTTITYESDLSGKPITDNDAPTVTFSLDGTNYEIDLTDAEQEKFRKALSPYIEAGKRVTGAPGKRSAAKSDYNAKAVREWAKSKGIDVPERGRIPANVVELYRVR